MASPANHIYQGANATAKDCIPVTKSDVNDVFGVAYTAANGSVSKQVRACRALLVGTAGPCDLVMSTGITRVNVPLQAGYNSLQVIQVKTTGTSTADNIWALI